MHISLQALTTKIVGASKLISAEFGKNHVVKDKADATPVTAIDEAINDDLRLWAIDHGLGFIGEEGNSIGTAEFYLYADPLDGTAAFIRGMATATTIATIMRFDGITSSTPLLAVIHNPITGQTWSAQRDKGAYASIGNNRQIQAKVNAPSAGRWRSAICAWPGVDERFAEFNRKVIGSTQFSDQQMGAFGLGGGLIASGLLHATAISATSAVETAAMSLIVREAGGVALDLYGKRLEHFTLGMHKGKFDFLLPNGALMASSQEIADALLQLY